MITSIIDNINKIDIVASFVEINYWLQVMLSRFISFRNSNLSYQW